MLDNPAEAVNYEYPDPDDLEPEQRYTWASNNNEYIPAAIRQTHLSSWEASRVDDGEHVHSPSRASWRQGYEPSEGYEGREGGEADYGTMNTNSSDGEVVVERSIEDGQMLAPEPWRGAIEVPSNPQLDVNFASASRSKSAQRGRRNRGNPGIKRGLRNPVEPEPEFKVLHSKATMAFIANDYEEAENLTLQALQINPEMYPAHSLLSQIHAARGDLDKAIAVAYSGAHTRPRDTEMWSRIARMLLDRDEESTDSSIKDAVYCYNRIISIDKRNVEARFQRAALNYKLGKFKQVLSEYELLNKYLPHDTTVLRHLAQVSIEVNEPHRALRLYHAACLHFQNLEPMAPTSFTWSDVNVLVELYLFCCKYEEGLEITKSLSRWLLGRRNDECWENFTEDDREWDLDDQPRRIAYPDFIPNRYEASTYGVGLPLDLRIKLGMLRLNLNKQHTAEAINHFEWLEPTNGEIGAKVFDYPDLFRDVARSLLDKGLHQDAIRFYEPLMQIVEHVDDSCRTELARCYILVGRIAEGEALQSEILDFDMNDDDTGDDDASYCQEDSVSLHNDSRRYTIDVLNPVPKRSKKLAEKGKVDLEHLKDLFSQRQSLKETFLEDQIHSKMQWSSISQQLVQRFMQEKTFFPDGRQPQSMDYTQQARHLVQRKAREKLPTTDSQSKIETQAIKTPDEFAGIAIDDWLDVFLEYGLSLAREGRMSEAYQIIASTTQATVFDHRPESLFLIHVCWFTCALLNDDDETLCSVSRWFMKNCQFVTDAYRLFSAVNRLCDGDQGWFNCGPSQKHILRQIKAMDFSLAGDVRKRNANQERSAYTARDADGNVILPQNMDVSLLMLYGHVLYAGKSYVYANNYFLRALSVDSDNAIIKLSLALGYLHHALKRQADNRHQLLMQGFAFLFEYYSYRHNEGGISEKQEAAYNVARAFHMLGLTHMAIPYYESCLASSSHVDKVYHRSQVEDFAQEAAVALQGIWATNGNEKKALEITEQWLELQ